jgi:hypothetical protein
MPLPVRSSLIASLLAVSLAVPKIVQAQIGIRIVPDDRFVAMFSGKDIPLIRFITEGMNLRAESGTSIEVVLFVARVSKGTIVSQGQTRPFRLDAKAASTSSGMRLGSALTKEEVLRLAPLSRSSEAKARGFTAATSSMSAAELLQRPLTAFSTANVRNPAGNDVLLLAVVPADAGLRARSQAGGLFMIVAPMGD